MIKKICNDPENVVQEAMEGNAFLLSLLPVSYSSMRLSASCAICS